MGIAPYGKRRLPSELAGLPTARAKLAYSLGEGGKMPSLEGPTFDRAGNFYCCRTAPNNTVAKRISPDGKIDDFCRFDEGMVIGLAFHEDGRCFATDMMRGSLRQISPDGEIIDEVILRDENGESLHCDCMLFDEDGTLLITDLRGTAYGPKGGIWRLTPDDNYKTAQRIYGGMASPNGICMSKKQKGPSWDSDALWIAESATNTLVRISLDDQHEIIEKQYSPLRVFKNPGKPNVDSCCIDEDGNIYLAIMFGGRVVVLDPDGLAIANVIVPGFEDWELQYTPNLAISPDGAECYLVASDQESAVVLSFPTLAKSQKLYSME